MSPIRAAAELPSLIQFFLGLSFHYITLFLTLKNNLYFLNLLISFIIFFSHISKMPSILRAKTFLFNYFFLLILNLKLIEYSKNIVRGVWWTSRVGIVLVFDSGGLKWLWGRKSEDSMWERVLSFHYMYSRNQTKVLRLSSKPLSSVIHLVDLIPSLWKQ